MPTGREETAEGQAAINALSDVYTHWVPKEKILTTSSFSAELIKLASNSFLAMRLSSINSIGMICEETHADIEQVSKGIGLDSRLGPAFLKASLGFGGSCFKKDVLGMAYLAQTLGLPEVAQFWRMAVDMNELRKARFCEHILKVLIVLVFLFFSFSFFNPPLLVSRQTMALSATRRQLCWAWPSRLTLVISASQLPLLLSNSS